MVMIMDHHDGVLGRVRSDYVGVGNSFASWLKVFDRAAGQQQNQSNGEQVAIPQTFVAEIYSKTKSLEGLESLLSSWEEEYEAVQDNQIRLYGKISSSGAFDFSERLFAVIHQMEKKVMDSPGIKVLTQFSVQEDKRYFYSRSEKEDRRKCDNFLPETVEISDGVFANATFVEKEKEGKKEITVKISSEILSVVELADLIKTWEQEYVDFNQLEKGLMYFVFKSPNRERHSSHEPLQFYSEFRFDSGKNFSNVFFPEKDDLVKKIEFFSNNEAWYLDRGIPHMFGLLLHGEPGCGKTSAIKAIANLTKRHIVSIPLKNVDTLGDLYHALYYEKIDRRTIPITRRLYVFEDIDCGGLDDIVKSRKTREEERLKQKEAEKEEKGDDSENKKEVKVRDLSLSDLLEAFDGVLEMKGRMIVITTNHLEKLDPALIRPGRVDTMLEFKKSKKETVREIFEHFFTAETMPRDVDFDQVGDGVWSPAEVVQICADSPYNPTAAWKKLVKQETDFLPRSAE